MLTPQGTLWGGRGNSLKEPATKAYEQVFAAHHSWTIRKAVSAGMFMLPTKTQFLRKLHEQGTRSLPVGRDPCRATPPCEWSLLAYIRFTDRLVSIGCGVECAEDAARAHMQDFVKSATPVVASVHNLFIAKELGTDW